VARAGFASGSCVECQSRCALSHLYQREKIPPCRNRVLGSGTVLDSPDSFSHRRALTRAVPNVPAYNVARTATARSALEQRDRSRMIPAARVGRGGPRKTERARPRGDLPEREKWRRRRSSRETGRQTTRSHGDGAGSSKRFMPREKPHPAGELTARCFAPSAQLRAGVDCRRGLWCSRPGQCVAEREQACRCDERAEEAV